MSDLSDGSRPNSLHAGAPRISVALITFNEEHNIADCLDSVDWADELIVVDQASSDRTAAIARAHGANVIVHEDWSGFGPQKNLAMDACTGDWILALDADERVTPELASEILDAVRKTEHAAFALPRKSSYCGRFMKYGGWADDYVVRLVRRGRGRFSPDRVHERLIVDGSTGKLLHHLLHYSIGSLEGALKKANQYSTESALMLVRAGARPTLLAALIHGLATFLRTYVFKLGFLDGSHGLMLAISNAEGSYYRYAKAMLLARQRTDRT